MRTRIQGGVAISGQRLLPDAEAMALDAALRVGKRHAWQFAVAWAERRGSVSPEEFVAVVLAHLTASALLALPLELAAEVRAILAPVEADAPVKVAGKVFDNPHA